ncbi:MAG: DUF2812 domain-containing protein [Lachnospiraceae bacterium]|nr:DUF2812 domain-containing protein [Lachnospiraceae bacterium]
MGNRKTVFKFFTIPQYQQEENYLSTMHENGWDFNKVTFPGFYHFEKCEPKKVTYRLDYNREGIRNKEEYVQMFSDCGWEHICDFVGYSYFRKEGEAGEESEEIFCDDASRLDMMKRVFMGRIIPLIIIFALVIIPQLFINTAGYNGGSIVHDVFSFSFLGLAILYLVLFSITAVQFYQYEKRISGDSPGIRLKYVGAFAIIVALVAGIALLFWSQYRSSYEVTENNNGYVVEAEKLNSSVVKEYDLKKGETIVFDFAEFQRGHLYLSVTESGKEPIFFGDFYNCGSETVEIQNDGHYEIEMSGEKMTGNVEVSIE